MNKTLIIIFFIFLKSYSQDFEGTIEYKISYEVLSKEETQENLKRDLGTQMTFTVKNGFTKEISDAAYGIIQIYNPKENKIFHMNKFSPDTLFFTSGEKKDSHKNAQYKVDKNIENILYHPCEKLIYTTENSEIFYFYSTDLKFDPKYAKNYNYTNRNKKLEIMKSVILKQIVKTKNFIATIEAVKITPRKISDAEFNNPEHKILKEEL